MWHLEHDNYYNYFSFSLSLSLFLSNRYKKGDCLSFSRERLSLSLSTSFFSFSSIVRFFSFIRRYFLLPQWQKKTPSLSYETSSPFGSTRAIRVREYNNETRKKKKRRKKRNTSLKLVSISRWYISPDHPRSHLQPSTKYLVSQS